MSAPATPGLAWRAAAILSLTLVATAVLVNLRDPFPMDFISYWAAGKLALGGQAAAAYDIAAHQAVQAGSGAQAATMPFPYPPPFLFVAAPFGALPFGWAAAAWIGLGLGFYAFAVRRLMPWLGAVALAFPPLVACGIIGQNGFLTAGLFMLAMAVLPSRPIVAGLLIAALAIKPQLGLLVPLALIAGREWRAFAGATAGVLLLAVASLAAFGLAAWQGFLALMPLYGRIAAEGLVGWNEMASLYAALRLGGAPDPLALALHAAAALAGAVLVWRSWRASTDPLARAATLATGTVLISPYLYVYDQLLLVPAIGWLWREGLDRRLIALLFVPPLATLAQTAFGLPGPNLAPLLPLALLALTWRGLRRGARPIPLGRSALSAP